ncbi:MAG: T9SS type A sorting domain-containing protein [Bacteroidetes bacterium]|nr:T9SS type A sorting domain-containing protein [Bacteroidota bacterium]
MKTKILLVIAALGLGLVKLSAQDLLPGINYSYNPPGANGIITNITIDVLNNDANAAGSFDVAMYLYDPNTTNYWIIGTQNIPSLSGNSLITISNWNIDINQTSGIPAGTYRLGVWTDSNSAITETDETNNAGLLAGNINYTPNASGISNAILPDENATLYPNPANENVSVNYSLTENSAVEINIFDDAGKLMMRANEPGVLGAGDHKTELETSSLPPGIYFVKIIAGGSVITKKLSVMH